MPAMGMLQRAAVGFDMASTWGPESKKAHIITGINICTLVVGSTLQKKSHLGRTTCIICISLRKASGTEVVATLVHW